jgi:hypothetical protein
MIHLLDFSNWRGRIDDLSWRDLEEAVQCVLRGDVSVRTGSKAVNVRLGGFGPAATVGAASLALVVVAAGLVGVGVTGFLSPNLFGVVSGGMLLMAMLAFAHMLIRVITIYLASR